MIDLDHVSRPVIAVTGMGVLTSLGEGVDKNWRLLTAGAPGIRRIERFPLDGLRTTVGATVDFVGPPDQLSAERSEEMALRAAREAVAQAGLGGGDFPGPLFLAMPPFELEWRLRLALAAESGANPVTYADVIRTAGTGQYRHLHHHFEVGSIAENLAATFGTKGAPIGLTTACASGATAIQLALESIRRGEASAALCVGTDGSITAEALIRFSLLQALSTRNDHPETSLRPFNRDRDGFVMGEGAGALVLESVAHARARGAPILGVVEGGGEAADCFHRTRSSPDGKPIIDCMRRAIADAGLSADDIDYINAHGTGTPENDKMEWLSIAAVFGDRASKVPVSSNKSMIGHTLSAAGIVEGVFTLLSLRDGLLPPTIGYETPDPAIPIDCVPNTARRVAIRHALSNSFGFGGQNVSIVFGAA
ncbi:MAG: beta-ketoacyl-ACP synthase [Acetobacteraceae bacterium]|nr:beta-ketoacyl-ACP synthase [Acetobacteraceae bacterium]